MATRLISFLGKGTYLPTRYVWPDTDQPGGETKYVAAAIAQMAETDETVILQTREASEVHESGLRDAFDEFNLAEPSFELIEKGDGPEATWGQFEILKKFLRFEGRVVLDITHGFRTQPFFASAVISFIQAVDNVRPEIRVVYGAHDDEKKDGVTPIWDLTEFIELTELTQGLMLFLKTGRGREVAKLTEAIGRERGKKQGKWNMVEELGKAIGRFSKNLETIRTGNLLLNDRATDTNKSSVVSLLGKIAMARDVVGKVAPPLADVLDMIEEMVEPLETKSLYEAGNQASVAALADLYFRLGRYAEAAVTVREGWVNLYAEDERAVTPGAQYDRDSRIAAAEQFSKSREAEEKRVQHCRNDIEHGGYDRQPMDPEKLIEEVEAIIAEFKEHIGTTGNALRLSQPQ